MASISRNVSDFACPAALALFALSAGCTERPTGGETDGGSTTGDTTTGTSATTTTTGAPTTSDTSTTGGSVDGDGVLLAVNNEVDILFVIDNSASMGPTQARLSQGIGALVAPLDARGAHYRIGFTTTDSGNPRCPAADTTPEGGKLVLSSCVDRVALGEFTVEQLGEDYSSACTDYCALTDASLPITPTATQFSDGELAPRRWVEVSGADTNLPAGVTPVQALQCFAPQGVSGCGFESHLESMYLALAQTSRPDAPTNYGFMREAAVLSVIIVSDETDCSYNPTFKDIFTTNKVFWEDPNGPSPTSAVCWNAGVACVGAGPNYPECNATNHDVNGSAGVADEQAVLQPLAKYVNFVQNIEDHKRQYDASQEVLVAVLGGVPVGYDLGDTEIIYEDAVDPAFQGDFGIGPGCVNGDQWGVPPVREREFAEAFQVGDGRNLHSVCAGDFSAALATIAARITDQIRPVCMPKCVADVDPVTMLVDPSCQLFETNLAEMTKIEVLPCVEVNGEWQPPAAETVCFAARVDQGGQTPSPLDDMSAECLAEGYNLEFSIVRTAPTPAGATIEAVCELSPNKAKDCPLL